MGACRRHAARPAAGVGEPPRAFRARPRTCEIVARRARRARRAARAPSRSCSRRAEPGCKRRRKPVVQVEDTTTPRRSMMQERRWKTQLVRRRDRPSLPSWRWPRAATMTTTAAGGGGGDGGSGGGAARSRCCCRSRRRRATSRRTGRTSSARSRSCARTARSSTRTPIRTRPSSSSRPRRRSRKGAKVLVLDPVDAASAGAIVKRAKQSQIPVISYDRLITDADIDYYISFDNERVGQLQGEALVAKLEEDGAERRHRDDQRRADRQQREAVQAGRAQRHRRQRVQGRQGVRHAGLEPRQGPAGDGAGDHRARQGRLRRASTPPTTAPPAARSPR